MPSKCDNSACVNDANQKSVIYRICSKECLNPLWTALPVAIRHALILVTAKRKETETETEEDTTKRLRAVENLLLFYASNDPEIVIRILQLLSTQDLERLIYAGGKDLNAILANETYSSFFYKAVTYQDPEQDETEGDYLVTEFLALEKYREQITQSAYQIFRHQTRLRGLIRQLESYTAFEPLRISLKEGSNTYEEKIEVRIYAEIQCHVIVLNLASATPDPKSSKLIQYISLVKDALQFDDGTSLLTCSFNQLCNSAARIIQRFHWN
jgi:hypothetical protein